MTSTNLVFFLMTLGVWIEGTFGECYLQNPVVLYPFAPTFRYSYEMFCERFPDQNDCHTYYGWPMYKFTANTAPERIDSICDNFSQAPQLVIENTQLESMGPHWLKHFDKLTAIHLSHNKIRRIGKHVFSSTNRLLHLDLSFNNIIEIEEDALDNNENLTHLLLNDNNITSLNVALFSGLTSLETLNLTNNPINHISPITDDLESHMWGRKNRHFARIFLKNTRLDLINCGHITSEFGMFTLELDMRQNVVTKISYDSFRELRNLRILDLSYNLIESIDDYSFGDQRGLTKLYLNNNRIRNLTDSVFSLLSKLNVLDLSNNPIARISENTVSKLPLSELYLGNLSLIGDNFRLPKNDNLRKLVISHNNMTNMDQELPAGSKNLSLLDLSYNNIEKFPTNLGMTIAHLIMNHNGLTEINAIMLSNRKALTLLDLSYNSISSIDEISFSSDTELVSLFLQKNKLIYIPATLFEDTTNLKYLDLSDNQISSLYVSTFKTCENLLVLNLSGNRLKRLGKLHLYHLRNLRELYLQSNQLREIGGVHFLDSLKEITLSDNPWECETLLSLFDTLEKSGVELAHDSDIHLVHHVRRISCEQEDIY